jgi:Ca-activated chloride channel family protein
VRRLAVACSVAIVAATLSAWSQTPLPLPAGNRVLPERDAVQPNIAETSLARITSTVNEVQLSFSALHRGHFVTDLQAEELKLLDNNTPPQRIGSFWKTEDLPLKIAFVVDASGSVATSFRTEQRSANRFLDKLLHRERDEATVISFTAEAATDQEFTADRKQLAGAIKNLHATQQGTAIFDALQYACERLRNNAGSEAVRKVIVLLTDGDDNASHSRLVDAIRKAQQNDVPVYVVQVNSGVFGKQSKERLGLQELTEQTGGKLYEADLNYSPAFKKIEEELRSQYVVTYTPSAWQSDGRFRRISLRALRSGIRIHCRPGYYASLLEK